MPHDRESAVAARIALFHPPDRTGARGLHRLLPPAGHHPAAGTGSRQQSCLLVVSGLAGSRVPADCPASGIQLLLSLHIPEGNQHAHLAARLHPFPGLCLVYGLAAGGDRRGARHHRTLRFLRMWKPADGLPPFHHPQNLHSGFRPSPGVEASVSARRRAASVRGGCLQLLHPAEHGTLCAGRQCAGLQDGSRMARLPADCGAG